MIQAETERKIIQNEAFLKMKEEQKTRSGRINAADGKRARNTLEREHEKTKQQEIDAYRMLMKLMMQLAVPAEMQSSLLQSLKISFSISNTEHMEVERSGTGERLYRCGANTLANRQAHG